MEETQLPESREEDNEAEPEVWSEDPVRTTAHRRKNEKRKEPKKKKKKDSSEGNPSSNRTYLSSEDEFLECDILSN